MTVFPGKTDTKMAGEKLNIIGAVKNYGKQLFGFIRSRVHSHEDAEDILQDVWVQLSSQTGTEDIMSLSGWLYQVAKNKITDSYRRQKTRTTEIIEETSGDEEGGVTACWQETGAAAERDQLQQLFRHELAEALEELPEEQRKVFTWHEIDGLTLREIAGREKENIKTIISRKRYAVQHLRHRLQFVNNEFLNG